nr:GNAT family N-acetyltransferase [Marivibrio halodurans]
MVNGWYRAPADGDGRDADEVPVAEAVMIPGRLRRTRAVATVGVGVLRAHWGRGLARALMRRIEAAARAAGHRRLELSVFAPNMRARRLYEGLGYDHEGIKRRSVDLPGHGPVDEWLMAKLL